jgi:hypothetical protein
LRDLPRDEAIRTWLTDHLYGEEIRACLREVNGFALHMAGIGRYWQAADFEGGACQPFSAAIRAEDALEFWSWARRNDLGPLQFVPHAAALQCTESSL